MDTWFAERAVGDLRVGDHALLDFANAEERESVVGTFVADGLLSEEERVVYLTDLEPGELPGVRRLPGRDPRPYLEDGRLRVISRTGSCTYGGRFEPGRMAELIGGEISDSQRRGLRAVRITTDFSWALDRPGGPELILDCESQFGAAVAPSTMAMAICQVARRNCPPDQFIAQRDTHEVLVEPDPEFSDDILRIVRTFEPHGLRVEGELDAARHAVFAEKLCKVTRCHPRVHLDLRKLRFIDLAGLILLAHHAARRNDGEPLILDNLPPDVEDVIEMVGWHMLPGLSRGRTGAIS